MKLFHCYVKKTDLLNSVYIKYKLILMDYLSDNIDDDLETTNPNAHHWREMYLRQVKLYNDMIKLKDERLKEKETIIEKNEQLLTMKDEIITLLRQKN